MSGVVVSSWLFEKRPLKRSKLGPPDVYPQDPKQKEDELTAVNVKQGFSNSSMITDEYGSARNSNLTPNKFGSYFSALLSKKLELNTFSESTRKKQQINTKDNIWLVTSKSKNAVDAWFKDLASNTKTLSQLSRKVPVFNKKEEIFSSLYEFKVPMFKSEWFLKMSSAYQIAISESNNKSKKRQLPDPSQEWTLALCKFLKEQFQKLCEYYHGVTPTAANPTTGSINTSMSSDEVPKQWQYYTQLARHLFEAGLLDKQDFLLWLLELLEKIKSSDDSVMGIVVPLVLQYVDEFTQSEHLSRKLGYQCAKKLNQLVSDYSSGQTSEPNVDSVKEESNTTNTAKNSTNNTAVNGVTPNTSTTNTSPNTSSTASANTNQSSSAQIIACFNELMNCSHHRNVILGLSVMIQIITLDCPTSLIWLNIGESKGVANLQGSPLDFLPCEPSNLPMPSRPHNQYLRNELRKAEEQIRQRSKLSEMHWFCDRWQQTAGTTVNKLLNVLDALDRQCFDKLDSNNSIDTLYSKIFFNFNSNQNNSNNCNNNNNINNNNTNNNQTNNNTNEVTNCENNSLNLNEILAEDEPIVRLLCEWAVTTKRTGEHRALVVAKLLEKRQTELTAEKDSEVNEELESETNEKTSGNNNNNNNKTNDNNNGNANNSSPTNNSNKSSDSLLSTLIYQNLLLNFLDSQAPVYEDRIGLNSGDNKQAFSNLILLFGELIRCDVFSHDLYMCTLISRGQFSNSPNTSLLPNSGNTSKTNTEEPSLAGFVPNLSTNNDLTNHNHLGGLVPNGLQKSQSSSSLPMFDPLSNNTNVNQSDQTRWDMPSMDIDENLDEDLDKLLQHIKAGQQNMSDQADLLLPDSVESDKEDEPNTGLGSHSTSFPMPEIPVKNGTARHLLYTMHFPLPQDDTFAHDCNQRHILLYGVGKAKDEAKHVVKKFTKEITKLFNRKSSMDISDGGKVKKHAIKEGFNFEAAVNKFQTLSTFDQHVVTTSCATAAVEMLNGVAIGSANYLPLIESIAFLFDLMELALNVHGLIEFIIQMLKELVEVDLQLHQKCPVLARTYGTSIGLYVVGVLYRYQTCLLVSHEETVAVFEGLWKLVRHVNNPSDCSSAERCILFYLWDLHSSYNYLRTKYHDSVSFTQMLSKIKQMSNSQMSLHSENSSSNMRLNASVMADYLKNPKLKVDPIHIRNLNENLTDRYSFVCNAIQCISMANDGDKLNEMSVLCAELTASCSQLSSEWLSALKALCCSSNPKSYYDLLTQVEVGDLSIHDNLAVFTSILIARRCFSLKDFILQVAVPSLLAPSSSEGADDAEPGARLTCHLLLCLFKTSETPLSSNTMTTFATSSRYSLTSPGPLVLAQTPPNPSHRPNYNIKYPCDRYLLAAAHSTLRIEIVLTVLKAILVLGNSAEKRNTETKPKTDSKGEISISDILGSMATGTEEELAEIGILQLSKTGMEKAGLSDAAKHALRQICGQQWVHDRCLRGFMIDPEILNKLLLDPKLSHKEAQHLLNMICHPKQIAMLSLPELDSDQKTAVAKILQNLDEWSIRVSWLQLQLMYAQSQNEVNVWLDNVAKATVDYFQNSSEEMAKNQQNSSQLTLFCARNNSKQTFYKQSNPLNDNNFQKDRVWLIGPLISKLPSTVEGKILKVAANVLESGNWMSTGLNQSTQGSYSKNKDRNFQQQKNSSNNSSNSMPSLLSHQPFLSLVLMCLKGQDEQRECLLNSLYSQLSQAINEKLCDDLKAKHAIQEGLQLRLSLVGGMFDMIQRSTSLINDWAILLLQLISFTIVDPQINYEIFTTVLDMLAVLMHTTQVSDSSEPREETKKQYQNLIKKLKKELNIDRITPGIKMVRQLLPIVKQQCEVITCEPMGSLIDTKGNKIAGFDSIDKKQGLQVAEKQKVSPWDLLEGHKNPSPLSWTWFGAVRIERKALRGEENHYLLARHNHTFRKPISYYLEAPPLPPEDVIPEQIPTPTVPPITNERIPLTHHLPPQQMLPNQMNTNQMIPNQMIPNMNIEDPMRREPLLDVGLRAPTPKKAKTQRRRRTPKNANGNSGQQTPPIRMPTGYNDNYGTSLASQPHSMPSSQPISQNWYGSQPPAAQPPVQQIASQQQYYPPQQQIVGPRFGDARPVGHSKGALRHMLSSRQGTHSQFNIQAPNAPNMTPNQSMMASTVTPQPVYQARQPVMAMRGQMRAPAPQMQVNAQQNPMYSMQSLNQTVNSSQPMHHMSVQQQTNYGGPPNMSFTNQIPMQNMEQTVSMSGPPPNQPPPGYNQHPSHNQMMMRPQMQNQQQMVGQQSNQQFITQRSQYPSMQSAPNVTMGQTMGQMSAIDNRNNNFNQNNMQAMHNTGAPHINQWQTTGQRPQQPMVSQLQRQLSGGNQQQHNPYHQNQY